MRSGGLPAMGERYPPLTDPTCFRPTLTRPVVGQLGVFPIDYVAHPVSHVSTKLGALNDMGIPQMVDHYAQLIGTPEVKPVVVGHSFGGLIAQELLANGVVAAAVAIDPAAIKGVKALPFAQLKSAFPVLGNPANLHRTVSLTPKQFHYAFGNTLPEEESDALHGTWTIPGAGLPLFQDAAANFFPHSPAKVDTHLADRGPLLLTSGTEDHTVPLKVTKEVFNMYSKGPADTEFHVFEGKGHSLTIDSGWQEVAEVALNWLASKGF